MYRLQHREYMPSTVERVRAPVISFTRLTTSSEEVSISSFAPIAFSSSKYALLRT